MNKLFKKFIAAMLVVTLAGANLSILGMYGISYAMSEEELEKQTTSTGNSNVEFNAYFEGGEHSVTAQVTSEDLKLYININVQNEGYLESGATVSFEDMNFTIGEVTDDNVQSVDTENNVITLNQINNGSNVTIEVPIYILNEDTVSIDNFSKETKTVFSGTYINGNGKEKSVSNEVVNKLSWEGTAEATVTTEFTTNLPYSVDGDVGVMVQAKVNSGIIDSTLPVQKTEITINVPEVNGELPTDITVVANNTKATTGDTDGINFTEENYSYDLETGVLTITVENTGDTISWLKDVTDEFLVTFIYEGQEIYNFANGGSVEASMTTTTNITTYGSEDVATAETQISQEAGEAEGAVVDFDVQVAGKMSKGQIYANYDVEDENKEEVSYSVHYEATVSSAALTGSIKFSQNIDKFLTEEDEVAYTTVSGTNYMYNKTVKISTEIFNKMLGEEGYINIYNSDDILLGAINNELEEQDGYYILDMSEYDTNEIYMVTSSPITEGVIEIDVEKAFKTDIGYSKSQMQSFVKLEASFEGTASGVTGTKTDTTNLKEPTSVASIEISKSDLTTVVTNEGVEIRAVLNTSDIYNALYTNPTLTITLPEYITDVDITNYDIVMANGLEISGKPKVTTNKNGKKVITITLEGTQQEYTIGAEYEGTIIILETDLTVDILTPSTSSKITMDFTNENEVSSNSEGTVSTEINFVAPTGVVAANSISNYADGEDEIMSISDEGEEGTLAIYSDTQIATITGTVINNYENAINNVVVLGIIPSEGNTEIDSEEDLGSTFTASLNSTITVSGLDEDVYTIYYSEVTNASTDLSDESNGWSTTATTNTTSYMIVLDETYELVQGDSFEFSYDIEIPANLTHNNSSSEMYTVYYNNVSEIGTFSETENSSVMTITTGAGPELTVELTSTVDTIREGQYVKMIATVTNTGSVTAENVTVTVPLPDYTSFVEYVQGTGFYSMSDTEQTLDVGTLEAGESGTVTYFLKIDNDTTYFDEFEDPDNPTEEELEAAEAALDYPKEIIHTVTATADEMNGEVTSNEYTLSIEEGDISIYIYSSSGESTILQTNAELEINFTIINISSSEELTNTIVSFVLPEGLGFTEGAIKESIHGEELTDGVTYDEESNTVSFTIDTFGTIMYGTLSLVVEEEGEFAISATALADSVETCYSNIMNYTTETASLELSELTSSPKYVEEGSEITYSLTITNNGSSTISGINIIDTLPEGVTFSKSTITRDGEESSGVYSESDGTITIKVTTLSAGESIIVDIIVTADLLDSTEDKTVTNYVTVSGNNLDEITTNSVTNTIEYSSTLRATLAAQSGSGDGTTITTTGYKITGTAWLDEDEDGERDSDEELLSGITIYLLSYSDNDLLDTTETSSSGTYSFTGLDAGKYIVIFAYDAATYDITTYQADGVDTSVNSDAISTNITLNGTRTIAGMTDVLTISSSNVRDIDIGLYVSEKFDLKLDKYISQITLTTPTLGTETYTYNNSQLAKVEVPSSDVGSSSMVIEYKIVITNEGAVAGYARKIVDYLSDDVSFSTDLNTDWYLSDNGNIYNTSLANEIIEPGETKELTLIVTKTITSSSIGTTLTNSAEIYETYNEEGLSDMDSTVANEQEDEDDMSTANIIISIKTGSTILYITIALGVIVILGFGVYEIKRRVVNKRESE